MFVRLCELKLYGDSSGILVQVRKNIHSESHSFSCLYF